jgi:hypothetical protein
LQFLFQFHPLQRLGCLKVPPSENNNSRKRKFSFMFQWHKGQKLAMGHEVIKNRNQFITIQIVRYYNPTLEHAGDINHVCYPIHVDKKKREDDCHA